MVPGNGGGDGGNQRATLEFNGGEKVRGTMERFSGCAAWPWACRRWGSMLPSSSFSFCRVAAEAQYTQFGRGLAGGGAGCLWMLVRASYHSGRVRKAPHGVAAAGNRFPVRASHRRGRVREWLRMVWRLPESSPSEAKVGARLPLSRASPKRLRAVWRRPAIAFRCAPPTVVGESVNGSAWCGGDRKAFIWDESQCAPPSITGESVSGSVQSGGGRGSRPSIDARCCKPTSISGGPSRALTKVLGESLAQIVWASDGNLLPEGVVEELLAVVSVIGLLNTSACGSGESLAKLCLVDDDYVATSFTSLKASLASSYALLLFPHRCFLSCVCCPCAGA